MESNKNSTLKTLFVVIGAIVCLGTAAALVYTFFKKHFKVTFACDGCDECCGEFEDDVDYEPICCCCEEEENCCCEAEAEADAE